MPRSLSLYPPPNSCVHLDEPGTVSELATSPHFWGSRDVAQCYNVHCGIRDYLEENSLTKTHNYLLALVLSANALVLNERYL